MAKRLIYQMYPKSWESFDDMSRHLGNVKLLGADTVWLSPFYPSPGYDHGYDIMSYRSIDARYGNLEDFRRFMNTAKSQKLQVIIDLVLNHTSRMHAWFKDHPEYYCWREEPLPEWKNLFDDGPAWEKFGRVTVSDGSAFVHDAYYLHLFHPMQADLRWFVGGELNEALVTEFRQIIDFWLKLGVDGFRLDVPQAINKNFSREKLSLPEMLFMGFPDNTLSPAAEVLNALFGGERPFHTEKGEKPYLLMEAIDPTFQDLVNYYVEKTPVDKVICMNLKEEVDYGVDHFKKILPWVAANQNLALDLESHDSPRFTSRSGLSHAEILPLLFESGAETVILYQGEELGLKNPDRDRLPDGALMALDAQTAMRARRGESLDDLRPLSRANARIPYPRGTLKVQLENPGSAFYNTIRAVEKWRKL